MTYSCDMIQDLLPLYCDDICSADTKEIVAEHLAQCAACQAIYKQMKDEGVAQRFQMERDNVVLRHNKQVKRKSVTVGITFATILMIPVIVTLIVNLAVGRTLDWFFIVLTSLFVLASVTVVPLLVERKKLMWTIGTFTGSLMLLLMTVAIFTRGNWFFLAAIPSLFGLWLCFGGPVLYALPQSNFLKNRKGLLYMGVSTVLLYCTIITSGIMAFQSGAAWRIAWIITPVALTIPWFMFAVIRYLPVNRLVKAGICTIFTGVVSLLIQPIVDWVLGNPTSLRLLDANLRYWDSNVLINANADLLVLLSCLLVGVLLLGAGIVRGRRK